MSFALTQVAIDAEAPELTSSDKSVLVVLARFADDAGACYPSTQTLISKTRLSRHPVFSAIKHLENLGFIKCDKQLGRGTRYQIIVEKLDCASASLNTSAASSTSVTSSTATSATSDTSVNSSTSAASSTTTSATSGTTPVPDQAHEYIKKISRNISSSDEDLFGSSPSKKTKRQKLPFETLPWDWFEVARRLRPELDPFAVFDDFRAYWVSPSAKGRGLKTDWSLTWRNWIKRPDPRRDQMNRWDLKAVLKKIRETYEPDSPAEAFYARFARETFGGESVLAPAPESDGDMKNDVALALEGAL